MLEQQSRDTGFRTEILEKAVHLLHLLQTINSHPFLRCKLVLKGGTALNLFLFNVPRLSGDIDLNYVGVVSSTVSIDPLRSGRDAGRIAEEVIRNLSGLVGANVQVTMEIQAEVPEGIPEDRQRIVNENCRTLKFRNFGFEEE